MQDLPIFEAVVEIIQAVLLSVTPEVSTPAKNATVGVDIKAKKKLHYSHESDCHVFYVRVSSSQELDLYKCLKDNVLSQLTEVLLYMQSRDDEGHLSVQRPSKNPQGCVQEVLWLDHRMEGDVTLKCQNSTLVPSVDMSEVLPFVIHFRVIQRETHILSAGHQIHKYLHNIKLLNEKIETTFSMKVCGVVCQTDFSVKRYLSVKDLAVVDDITYFFGKSCPKSLWCGTVTAGSGKRVIITDTNHSTGPLLFKVSVSNLACFYPLTERYPHTTGMSGISGHIIINFYGPELTPLRLSNSHYQQLDLKSLTNWGIFAICLKDIGQVLPGDIGVAATLTNLRYLPPSASGCTSFLLCLAVVFADCQAKQDITRYHEIFKYFQDDHTSLKQNAPFIGESISSSLSHIFVNRETEQEKLYQKTYIQCIEMITSSMCDIFNQSTDLDFRSSMVRVLQAENKDDMRNKLKRSLTKLANVPKDTTLKNDSSEEDSEVDGWEDSISTVSRKASWNSTQEDTLQSQQSTSGDVSQPVISDEVDPNISRTEQEMFSDMQELNDFDDMVRSETQHFWHPASDHSSAEFLGFSTDPVPIQHQQSDRVAEQEIEFFADPHFSTGYSWRNIALDNGGGTMEDLVDINRQRDTGLLTHGQIPNSGRHPHNAVLGDEWLTDVMLEMADWV